MTMTRVARACAALLVLLSAPLLAGQTIQVTPITRDDQVLVTFRLSDIFTEDTRTAIHSGTQITFVYDVELKRGATLWLDRTLASATVTASVRYDNLTGRYHLTRKADGQLERVEVLEREEEVRARLTGFERLPLFSARTLERNAEYYVRVRAHTTPRNASFVWPWQGTDVSGLAKFTVLR
jgi:hypothetical protein